MAGDLGVAVKMAEETSFRYESEALKDRVFVIEASVLQKNAGAIWKDHSFKSRAPSIVLGRCILTLTTRLPLPCINHLKLFCTFVP